MGRPFPVGLHHHTETIPARQRGVREHRLDDVEREVEPVRFLGIDVQPDAGGLREQRERTQPRGHLGHHPVALCELVARVQGGELDRHPGPIANARSSADAGERGDRVGVREVVTPCVGPGAGRLPQHVVREAVALRLHRGRAVPGLAHVPPEHELVPELAHRLRDRGADDRLAEASDRFVQRPRQTVLRLAEHLAGEQERPCRGVHQRRARMTQVRRPVRRPDLVLDQRIDGLHVRDSQQRLGEAHERHALACREPVLGEKALHDGGSGPRPGGADQLDRADDDRFPIGALEPGRIDPLADRARFVLENCGAHRRAYLGESEPPVGHAETSCRWPPESCQSNPSPVAVRRGLPIPRTAPTATEFRVKSCITESPNRSWNRLGELDRQVRWSVAIERCDGILLTFQPAIPATDYALRYPIATLAKLGRVPLGSTYRKS